MSFSWDRNMLQEHPMNPRWTILIVKRSVSSFKHQILTSYWCFYQWFLFFQTWKYIFFRKQIRYEVYINKIHVVHLSTRVTMFNFTTFLFAPVSYICMVVNYFRMQDASDCLTYQSRNFRFDFSLVYGLQP